MTAAAHDTLAARAIGPREHREPDLPRTEPELRARRLGFALRSLAAELVDERRKVAQLRQENAELKAGLGDVEPTQDGEG